MNIHCVQPSDEKYPKALAEITYPPKKLYIRGALHTETPLVAIVGSRKATHYGKEVAQRISYDLAAFGVGIVSGLAHGIDAIAHRAAVEAGGYTVAVMASGLDTIYPARNRDLARNILKNKGAIISEYEEGTPPLRQHFPARNRIIAGLSLGTIIIEAAERSGALITARFALEENREVMAVPGNTTNPLSAGANNLIKDGAAAITNANDVLDALRIARETDKEIRNNKIEDTPRSKEETRLLDLLSQGVTNTEAIIHHTGWDVATFNRTITTLEITGLVRRLNNDTWAAE